MELSRLRQELHWLNAQVAMLNDYLDPEKLCQETRADAIEIVIPVMRERSKQVFDEAEKLAKAWNDRATDLVRVTSHESH